MGRPGLLEHDLLPPWQLTTQQDQTDLAELAVVTTDEELLLLVLLYEKIGEEIDQFLPVLLVRNVDQSGGGCGINIRPDLLYVDEHLHVWSWIFSEAHVVGVLAQQLPNMMETSTENERTLEETLEANSRTS